MSRLFKIVLAISLVGTPQHLAFAQENGTVSETVNERIERFYVDHADVFSYAVTMEDLIELYEETNGSADIVLLRIDANKSRIEQRTATPRAAYEHFDEVLLPRRQEANEIADAIFAQRLPEDINITLVNLMTDFVIRPEIRGQLTFILEAIVNKHFSEEELVELEKKTRNSRRFFDGFDLTGKALIGLAMIGAVTAVVKGRWNALRNRIQRARPAVDDAARLAERETVSAARLAEERRIRELIRTGQTNTDEFVELAGRQENFERFERILGLTDEVVEESMEATTKVAVAVPKLNILSKLSNVNPKSLMAGTAYFLGLSVAGGVANMARLGVADLWPESFGSSPFNPEWLRDEYYDPLAILHLSCQSREMYHRLYNLENPTQVELSQAMFDLQTIYADFTVLKAIMPEKNDTFEVHPSISYSPNSGNIEYNLVLRDYVREGQFNCREKYQDTTPTPLTVSLPGVYQDVKDAFELLMNKQAALNATLEVENTENDNESNETVTQEEVGL